MEKVRVTEEKRMGSPGNHEEEEDSKKEKAAKVGTKRKNPDHDDIKSLSPNQKDLGCNKQEPIVSNTESSTMEHDSKMISSSILKEQDNKLESTRAEIGEVREENQRLKMYLSRIMKDYQTLQMQYYEVIQQEDQIKKSPHQSHQETMEESELFSLSLGRVSNDHSRKDYEKNKEKQDEKDKLEGLSLGLNYKYEVSKSLDTALPNSSPANSISDYEIKEEGTETWPPNKAVNTTTVRNTEDQEVLQQNAVKKARVSVRARCDTPTMNDGCQWRKYGQKVAKGNPCPRAYYRCTVAPSCPVRKQVQRCADDMSILITTYEGTHNHPLPMAATAMASTTSAAASMLLSGSSSSTSRPSPSNNPPLPLPTTPSNLHGLNFYLSDTSKSKQIFLPNSPLSSTTSYPTITLDLTSSTPSSSSSPFNRFSSQTPRYPSTSLNFSSSSQSNTLYWSNGFLTHGNNNNIPQPYIKNLNLGRPSILENNIYQSFLQKNHQQSMPPDTVAAATKAITTDPSFQSALRAALTSIIGNNGSSGGISAGNQLGADKLKWGVEQLPFVSGFSSATSSKTNGCASSYLNKSSSTTTQSGSLIFLPPPLPFSTSKSASASPSDHTKDQSS